MYDAYGKVTILDGTTGGQTDWATDADQISDVANDILFAGYRFDPETGLYSVRNRTYHPTLGRWIQRDPAGYVDGLNLYAYCNDRANGSTDPLGLAGSIPDANTGPWKIGSDFDLVVIVDPDKRSDAGADAWAAQRARDLGNGTDPKDLVKTAKDAKELAKAVTDRYKQLGRPLRILIIGHGTKINGPYIGPPPAFASRIPLLPYQKNPQATDPGGMGMKTRPGQSRDEALEEARRKALENSPIGRLHQYLADIIFANCFGAYSSALQMYMKMLTQLWRIRVRGATVAGWTEGSASGFEFRPEFEDWDPKNPWIFDTAPPCEDAPPGSPAKKQPQANPPPVGLAPPDPGPPVPIGMVPAGQQFREFFL